MPLPIHVVLIGKYISQVKSSQKFFKMSTPGIGPAYYSSIEPTTEGKILLFKNLPRYKIDLWLCLDDDSFSLANDLHSQDLKSKIYNRGFYDILFPDACVLLKYKTEKERNLQLKEWEDKIKKAWISTS